MSELSPGGVERNARRKPVVCKQCGVPIIWFRLARKTWYAVTASEVESGDGDPRGKYANHFSSCKKAEPKRPYTKPDVFSSQAMKSDYIREIPAEEEERITQLLEGRK